MQNIAVDHAAPWCKTFDALDPPDFLRLAGRYAAAVPPPPPPPRHVYVMDQLGQEQKRAKAARAAAARQTTLARSQAAARMTASAQLSDLGLRSLDDLLDDSEAAEHDDDFPAELGRRGYSRRARDAERLLTPDSLDEQLDAARLREVLAELFEKVLDPREAQVLRLRFGLGDDNDMTLEAVAASGLMHGEGRPQGSWFPTGERVRQIEAKALRALQHTKNAGRLKPFLSWYEDV